MRRYFVTGIGTDVGKTVVSAILAQAWRATYWKPVQAGDIAFGDKDRVAQWCSDEVTVLPNRYALQTPASPHFAAQLDGVTMQLSDFCLPDTAGNLVVEGAGGLLVPINEQGDLYVDLIQRLGLPVIVVSRHYLGSINHTLMTLEILRNRSVSVAFLVFVGDENPATESIITRLYPEPEVIRIPLADQVDEHFIREQAENVRSAID